MFDFTKIKDFGFRYYLAKTANVLYSDGKHHNSLSWSLWQLRTKRTTELLMKRYKYIIDKYVNERIDWNNPAASVEKRIWTLWWQGEAEAPDIVKACFSAMRRNCSGKVTILDQNNYMKYVELPDYIVRKVSTGQISLTHFSDILRMHILERWGGIWLDATILPVTKLEDAIFTYPYYTAKNKMRRMECISYARWCGFLLAGQKDFVFFRFATDFFNEYWRKEEHLVDYFLIDYVTNIALESLPAFKDAYDRVPLNNTNILNLEQVLSKKYNPDDFQELCRDTIVFKLNWKQKYEEYDTDGELTYFGYLMKKYVTD